MDAAKTTPDSVYCSLPRRFLIMFYDSIVMLGLLIIASAIALPFGDTTKYALQNFWFTAWLALVCFAYLGACWHYAGSTVGMRAWRVKLVSPDKKVITWPMCLLRFMTGIVSTGLLGAGILWALVDTKNRGWHDLAAHTELIRHP